MNADVQYVNSRLVPGDLVVLRLLDEIERGPASTQRDLSRRVGISLGMTNLLVRRLVRKAWIKVRTTPRRRMLYALTPRGAAEKARRAREFVRLSLRYYVDLKRRVAQQIPRGGRVASVGAGELARLVAEAARQAGARYVGDSPNGKVDLIILFHGVPASQRAGWVRAGAKVVDLT